MRLAGNQPQEQSPCRLCVTSPYARVDALLRLLDGCDGDGHDHRDVALGADAAAPHSCYPASVKVRNFALTEHCSVSRTDLLIDWDVVVDPLVVVVHSHRQRLFGTFLANNVLIQVFVDLLRWRRRPTKRTMTLAFR